MEVTQIYNLVNDITKEVIGEEVILEEDLSNLVDVGTTLENMNMVDTYTKKLVNRVGKLVFVNRAYSGAVPSVYMDSYEFGSIMEKVSMELPEAEENESWTVSEGDSVDPNIFKPGKFNVSFYNKKVTFEIDLSITEVQIKQSFVNAGEMNSFISMIYNAVDRSMTIKIDGLIMRTINNMIAETLHDDFGSAALTSKSGVKAVNLLYLYNQKYSKSLTAADAITDSDFLRYASYIIGLYMNRLTRVSTLFNIEGKDRFTPSDLLHVVLLADFAKAADSYLQSDVFHNEFTKIPGGEVVPYWQGSGKDYAFSDTSKIKVKSASGADVEAGGILAIAFDRDALGVTNQDRRTTTHYNPKGEFYNNFYKFDMNSFNSTSENFVVFFAA